MNRSPASIVRRGIATGIDFLIVPAVSFLLMLVTGAMETASAYAGLQPVIRPVLLGIAGYLIVNGWLLYARGQTLGKLIAKVQIVRADADAVAPFWKLVLIRGWFFAFLYLPLGFSLLGVLVMIPVIDCAFAFRSDRRCLHDLLCGTRVVDYA